MPSSKGKKHSKSQSKLSNSNKFSSPGSLDFEATEESFASSLELASVKFPSLIGNSAFIGRVTDVQDDPKSRKIWLSEPSMVASSFTPGSIVSVSLPCLKSRHSDEFPLSSLADECARRFGVDSCGQLTNDAGNYFALATIFPSSKVTKNGVLLSSSISNTMGCPPSGRVIFIHSVQNHSQAGLLCDTREARSTIVNCLSVYDCKELVLEMLHSNNTSANFSSEKSCYGSENGMLASPETPLNQSKLSVSDTSPVTSPRRGESVGNVTIPNESSVDSFDIEEVLGDDSTKRLLQTCARTWLYSRCLLIGNFVIIPMLSQLCLLRVIGAKTLSKNIANHDLLNEASELVGGENDAFLVKRETKVCFHLPSNPASETPQRSNISTGDDTGDNISRLGGLSKEYADLKEIIISSSTNSLSSFRPIRGVVLHGPPGTGKTSLARLCARDSGIKFFSVNVPKSEQDLIEVFDSARQAAPSVVFIDEIHAIAPARKDGGEELSERIVVTLMTLMDGISRTEGVVVIAATNRLDSIDSALRRAGRFEKEIEIGVPSPNQRLEILHDLVGAMEHSLSDEQVQDLANATHGFVGADLAALCTGASLDCHERHVKYKYSHDYLHQTSISHEEISVHVKGTNANGDNFLNGIEEECVLKVTFEDFEKARMRVRPSAMREVKLEIPKVNWEDVGGQREVKKKLKQAVIWPQKHQKALKRIGIQPPTGVMMFGPPGCSKTLMARAVASEARLNFLAVKGPELFSKWVGESEKAVKSLFAKARANAPAIIFFDEIDGLAAIRGKESDSVSDRVIGQLLVELDGFHARDDVTVIAATNRMDKIDSALLRPGRFDRRLHVRPPDEPDREEIFHIHLRKIRCSSDVNIYDLARLSEGCTGADISFICQQAGVEALEENLDASEVKMKHFKTAIKQVKPKEIRLYQGPSENFQGRVASSAKITKPFLSVLLHIFVTCLLFWWICC
ncbi:calmodulin-interacting protein 111-like isoform X2 [Prunus avium]|uniref:Calmodulin-interacting protein 111-like isoform X2 n=1 Tax=Prunus avium TaxID=42229 RepID=A0A6P5RXP8_PRUAV|nr:calmodulin-interacting protein 111-like isoform X2 [Prunus avium]